MPAPSPPLPARLSKRPAFAAGSSPASFACYLQQKRNPFRRVRTRETAVEAYLCRVLQLEDPLEIDREPTWFSASRAKRRLREARAAKYGAELERVVDWAVERISKSCTDVLSTRIGNMSTMWPS